MRTLYFDFETSGLVNTPSLAQQPGIVQTGAILVDETSQEVIGELFAWTWPVDHQGKCLLDQVAASDWHKEHGITPEEINYRAVNTSSTLRQLLQMMRKADRIVAHHIQFDWWVFVANYLRTFNEDIRGNIYPVPKLCTMQSMLKYKHIGNLEMIYRRYINAAGFANAHNAMADAKACRDLAFFIEKNLKRPLLKAI